MRNIGLDVKPPSRSCEDSLCPFHGTIGVRGRVIKGKAVSIKAKNMAVVEREYLHYIRKYMRYEKRKSRVNAHVPQCLDIKEGDMVTAAESRPISKTVAFIVVEKAEA